MILIIIILSIFQMYQIVLLAFITEGVANIVTNLQNNIITYNKLEFVNPVNAQTLHCIPNA